MMSALCTVAVAGSDDDAEGARLSRVPFVYICNVKASCLVSTDGLAVGNSARTMRRGFVERWKPGMYLRGRPTDHHAHQGNKRYA